MNFPRPWILRTPLTSFNSCMSSSSKTTNHYFTLKVDPDATQEEIKTAYYKLTKQYHPDVNQSEEAKEKFRNVSEAYEIIGNYKARKQYDRGMIAQGIKRSSDREEKNIPHMAFYKSRMEKYQKAVRTSDSKIYDFDAWTRAHYGNTFKRTISRRAVNKEHQENLKNMPDRNKLSKEENKMITVVLVVLICAVILLEVNEDFDVVKENRKESTEKSE